MIDAYVLNKSRGRLRFSKLPHEIIVEIFYNLTPVETRSLISKLNRILELLPTEFKTETDDILLLRQFAFQRLYSGKLLITSDSYVREGLDQEKDTVLSLSSFEDKFQSQGNDSIENALFKKTRPQVLKFRFVREANDYSNFVTDLYALSGIFNNLKDHNEVTNYIGVACQLELHIDGYTIGIESPTAILVAVLKTLISLANPHTVLKNSLSSKFKSITIKSTDIGNYYVSRWSRLLGNFTNVTHLNLADNIIRLDSNSRNEGELDIKIDFLANDFVWPPALRELILDSNLLTYISKDFWLNLPSDTLEVVLLSSNKIVTLGQSNSEFVNLSKVLPNLTTLKLNYNNHLIFLNQHMFENTGARGKFKLLELKGCNIDENNIQLLKNMATKERFRLLS